MTEVGQQVAVHPAIFLVQVFDVSLIGLRVNYGAYYTGHNQYQW